MSRRVLKRRLLSLSAGEGMAILVFAWLYSRAAPPAGSGVLYAFVVLEFLLLQGSVYWATWLWWPARPDRAGVVRVYRALRPVNVALLLGLLPAVWLDGPHRLAATALGAFAAAEYVNYFQRRLSYPLPEFLRRLVGLRFGPSLLSRELRR
ncbi:MULTISPECIES: hypothetical protein [Deinococcus]|uniref:Uncharacterized protein n=1 Tax=Deinococcus rufus TaxID=2136097 RepID=A0ABV7Z9T8_9DEIO|nr:hypothetical protein [Deinococcus sp. AB2017081]WQE95678.1 hypothetical protein U2P90_02005 [Deinococcus sp. AB2017081]